MTITHYTRDLIDTAKWNNCIARSYNGLVYSYAWYLDIACPFWEALVADDYQFVFPLPNYQRNDYLYLYSPHLAPHLGVFGAGSITPALVTYFLEALPHKYHYIELGLNPMNIVETNSFEIKTKLFYQIDLISSHGYLYNQYSPELQNILKDSANQGWKISKGLSAKDLIYLIEKESTLNGLEATDVMRRLFTHSSVYKFGESFGVYADEELIAGVYGLFSHGRAINLLMHCSPKFEHHAPLAYLFDYLFKSFAERNLSLQLGEVDRNRYKNLISNLGAVACCQQIVHKENLPWYSKIFKNNKV